MVSLCHAMLYTKQPSTSQLKPTIHQVLLRAVEGSSARQFFSRKLGLKIHAIIDVFCSRISNPDEKSYDPMVTTVIM